MALAAPEPAVTGLFELGRNCCAVARAKRVSLLIDGEAYFRAFAQAAERATRSILIVAWDFSSTTRLTFDGTGRHDSPPDQLGDFLNWLAHRRRDLHIRILEWDYPMLYATDREFPPPIYGLGWKPHHRIELVYDDTEPVGASHHQKIVVIDDAVAFVGGFDLTDRRWDTPEHCVNDCRRVAGSVPYPPFHDVMLAVDGDAAKVLSGLARQRWQAVTGHSLPPVFANHDPWPFELVPDLVDVDVAIARTMPAAGGEREVREIEALYFDMIAAAQSCIYIENQYFTASGICEALARRLAEPEGPEIVLVLRLLSHGWLEEHTMHVLRTRHIQQLRDADRYGRLHIYYAHLDGLAEGTCIDIHAKLMIVDDEILRVGSANLCNRSMGMDTECDAAIAAGGDAEVGATIRSFRNRLLGEHLDVPAEAVDAETRRRGSVSGAIAALQGRGRTLKPFDSVPECSDAVFELASIADLERPVSLDRLIEELTPEASLVEAPRSWRSTAAKLGGAVCFVLGLLLLWRYTPLARYFSIEQIVAWAHHFADRPWAPLVILGAYTPACVVMFPRPLITLGAIVAFGPILGTAYALAGIMLAALATYGIGRRLPRHTVRSLAGGRLNRITETLRRRGLVAVTALRLVPVAPFAVLGLVAGAIHIRLWHFMLGTLFGMMPGTLTTMLFGSQIEAALQDPSRINYGLIAAVLVVLVLLSLVVRKWLVRQARRVDAGHSLGS